MQGLCKEQLGLDRIEDRELMVQLAGSTMSESLARLTAESLLFDLEEKLNLN